jgi:hypothetical protein
MSFVGLFWLTMIATFCAATGDAARANDASPPGSLDQVVIRLDAKSSVRRRTITPNALTLIRLFSLKT